MSILNNPNLSFEEIAARISHQARNLTPDRVARGDQLIAQARGQEVTLTLPMNDVGALIALILESRNQGMMTEVGAEMVEGTYRRIVAQLEPVAVDVFGKPEREPGVPVSEVEDRLREDLPHEEKLEAVYILGAHQVSVDLPLWKWSAIIAALEALERVMDVVYPAMREDVMPIVQEIDAIVSEAAGNDVPRSIVDQLEAGGYLREKDS